MADPVLSSLRGKVLESPEQLQWRLQPRDDKTDYAYSLAHQEARWTPLNSNLLMEGIKVKTFHPVPVAVALADGDATECTLSLLGMIRERRRRESRATRQDTINKMARDIKEKKVAMEVREKEVALENKKKMQNEKKETWL